MHPCFAIFLLHIFSHSNDNATIFGILQTSTTTSKPKLSKTHEKGRSFTLNGKFLRLTWEAHSDWICMMPRWSGRAISRLSCSNDGQLFLCSLIDGWSCFACVFNALMAKIGQTALAGTRKFRSLCRCGTFGFAVNLTVQVVGRFCFNWSLRN